MNEIGYNLLSDASTKRKISILNLLLESDLPILISELAEICEVSQKTMKKDIQTLIKLFPGSFTTDSSSVLLNSTTDMNQILNYIENEVKNNVLFSIVSDTFYGRNETIDSLSDKYFLSESTLRKYLSTLKTVLEKFDLTLNLSPIEILGDEIHIRYFYFHFFEQVAEFHDNYSKNEKLDLYAILRNLLHNYNLILNIDYHRLVQWMAVIEQRINQKKFVYLNKEIINKYSQTETFSILKTAANFFNPDRTF